MEKFGAPKTTALLLWRTGEFALINAGRLLLVPVFAIVAAAAVSQFTDARSHYAIRAALATEARFEQPVTAAIRRSVPTRLKGKDVARWLLVMLIYLASVGVSWAG